MSKQKQRVDDVAATRQVGVQSLAEVAREAGMLASPPYNLPPSHDEDPFMSYGEVARYLGKSPQTIMRWVADGLLIAERIGPLPKIRRSTLAKFLGGTALQQKV